MYSKKSLIVRGDYMNPADYEFDKDEAAIAKLERWHELTAAQRSLNQLISLVAGARFARQTDQFKDDPLKRLDNCITLVVEEYKDAMLSNDTKAEGQANRKLDSFKSLRVLAVLVQNLIKENQSFQEYYEN